MNELEHRVERLEREVQRYRRMCAGFVVVLLIVVAVGAAPSAVQQKVSTRRLEVVNDAGIVIFKVATLEDGTPIMRVSDSKGDSAFGVVAALDSHSFGLFGPKETVRVGAEAKAELTSL